MDIKIIDGEFAICSLPDFSEADLSGEFVFSARTDEEASLVCPVSAVPDNALTADIGWRALRICGTLDFSLIGILSAVTKILAENKICVFAVSTYNTDYIFTKSEDFDRAVAALCENGYNAV